MDRPYDEAAVERLMRHLHRFVQDIGFDEAKARQIIEQIIIDMPLHSDEERVECACSWMLAVSS